MNPELFLAQIARTADSLFSPDSPLFSGELLVIEIALVILLIFWPLLTSAWLFWRNEFYKASLKWVLLEIKIPREIEKSPKAMEQVFNALHSLRNAPADLGEKWWEGEVTRWFSLEMVSFGGEIHFYIRTYYKLRDLVEAAFFSYYHDVELVEVDDYMNTRLPSSVGEIYEQGYDVWGSEIVLSREAAYPIKSYTEFESPEEERQVDPISSFLEVLAKVKQEQFVGIQIIISPAPSNWHEKWRDLVDELNQSGRTQPAKNAAKRRWDFSMGPLPLITIETDKKGEDMSANLSRALYRSPGETDVLKAVEKNLSKPAFDTLIRFVYLSPKSMYYDSFPRRGIAGSFNQYAALDLNSFVQNWKMGTRSKIWDSPYIFPETRVEFRKQRLLYLYRNRKLPIKTFIGKLITSTLFNWNIHSRTVELNTESLATIFHPPTRFVLTAPHMVRTESRKAGPPAGLAIFGEEDSIDKMMQ